MVLFNLRPVKDVAHIRSEVERIVARQKRGSDDDLSAFRGEINDLLSAMTEFHREWKKLAAVFRVAGSARLPRPTSRPRGRNHHRRVPAAPGARRHRRRPAAECAGARDAGAQPNTPPARSMPAADCRRATGAGTGARGETLPGRARGCRRAAGPCG